MLCPFCKEEIKDGAIKCKHCGSMLYSVPADLEGQTERWVMAGWQAVMIAIGLFFLYLVIWVMSWPMALIFIFCTSLWASYDAGKIKATRYRSRFLKPSPGWVFGGCLLLWIVVFPWYLYFRTHVLAGVAIPANMLEYERTIPDIAPENDSLNR